MNFRDYYETFGEFIDFRDKLDGEDEIIGEVFKYFRFISEQICLETGLRNVDELIDVNPQLSSIVEVEIRYILDYMAIISILCEEIEQVGSKYSECLSKLLIEFEVSN